MTPTPKFVLDTIIRERMEAALKGERVSAEDIAIRWETHHKIRSLLPTDQTLCAWFHAALIQRVRLALHIKDKKGSRLILSPVPIGRRRGPRGYVGREAMTVGEHVNLGNQQIATGKRKLTEGESRVGVAGQALGLGRSMSAPLGELAAEVSAEATTE